MKITANPPKIILEVHADEFSAVSQALMELSLNSKYSNKARLNALRYHDQMEEYINR